MEVNGRRVINVETSMLPTFICISQKRPRFFHPYSVWTRNEILQTRPIENLCLFTPACIFNV